MIKITKLQREMIEQLMKKAEYDTRTVTIMHRRLGVTEGQIGKPVKNWLDLLDSHQASDLIRTLKGQVS